MSKSFKEWILFIGAALLGAIAMDFPQTLWALIFVFLAPLIHVGLRAKGGGARAGVRLFGKMFVFGFVFAVFSTPWIASTYPLTWLNLPDPVLGASIVAFIWIGFGIALALPLTPWIFVLSRIHALRPVLQAMIAAATWILLEYARSWFVALSAYGGGVLFGPHHTYYSLAYVLSGVPVIRDLFAVGGMPLVSFIVVLCNFFMYHGYRVLVRDTNAKNEVFALGIIILGVTISSSLLMSYIRSGDDRTDSFTVAVLNTHLPSSTNAQIADHKAQIALDLIKTVQDTDGILVVPENLDVLNPFLEAIDPSQNPLSNFHLVIASHPDVKAHSMYFFEPATKQGVRYRKQLLMPIGEYSVDWVEYLVRATHNRSWIDVYDYRVIQNGAHKGTGTALYRDPVVQGAVFAGSICAENISPYIFRDETRAGATVLTNLSALSPFRNSPTLQRQTRAIDTARALENGRYLIVAGNDNASFVVSDEGDINYQNDTSVPNSVFNAEIYPRTYTTPYVRLGDYMVLISGAFLLIICVWLLI